MPLILIHSERFALHVTPPGHPERPERAEAMDVVAARFREAGGTIEPPSPATRDQLARVHDPRYIDAIASTSGRAVALDPDTFTSPDSYTIALEAAGAAVAAVEKAWSGSDRAAFALVRPPGHHAERDRAMGFCLFNNVAVAAAHASTLGARRVAIIDYDVHHGNGTQHIFERDADVLYISTHQYPYYPGTGASDEIGIGPGAGATVNLPLEAGATDDDYRVVFERVVLPILRQFAPDLLLVSAGFDAHERDPLGGMRVTTPAFGAMTQALRGVADECCRGRIALVTEGGYDLRALAASLEAAIQAVASPAGAPVWPSSGIASDRGERSADATSAALSGWWKVQ